MAIAIRRHLWALKSEGGSDSVTIDLGSQRPFIAWGSVSMIDPLNDFDADNAYALDIFTIDGELTGSKVHGGEHWGAEGSGNNVFEGAVVGNGRFIEVWLRAIHTDDLDAFGVACVVTLD